MRAEIGDRLDVADRYPAGRAFLDAGAMGVLSGGNVGLGLYGDLGWRVSDSVSAVAGARASWFPSTREVEAIGLVGLRGWF